MKNGYLKRKKLFSAYGHIQLSKKKSLPKFNCHTALWERWTVIMCIGDSKKNVGWLVRDDGDIKLNFPKKNMLHYF